MLGLMNLGGTGYLKTGLFGRGGGPWNLKCGGAVGNLGCIKLVWFYFWRGFEGYESIMFESGLGISS
jgi:hypothetical protein